MRFIASSTVLVLTACMPARPAPTPQPPVVEIPPAAEAAVTALATARDRIDDRFRPRTLGLGEGSAAVLPPPVTKVTPGQRNAMFKDAVTMICAPTDVAAAYNSFAQALLLFSPTQTEKIGNWIHWIQGGLSVLGGAASVYAMTGSDADKSSRLTVGVAFLGGGGLLELLKSTDIFKSQLVNSVLVRVELNRQLGVLIRQYTPGIDAVKEVCDSKLRPAAAQISDAENAANQIQTEGVKDMVEASNGLAHIYEGLLNIGSATGQIKQELDQAKIDVGPDVVANLQRIADVTSSLRKNWLADQSRINRLIDCIQFCPAP